MKRRDFLKATGGAAVGGMAFAGLFDAWASATEAKPAAVADLFESDNPEVLALAQRVFDKCILDKLRPPVEPLRHRSSQADLTTWANGSGTLCSSLTC